MEIKQQQWGGGPAHVPVAAPVADGVLADSFAFRLRVRALGVADGITADSLTFWAAALLTVLDRASNFAFGAVALDQALGASKFLAAGGALRRLANGFTNLVADGAVAFPLALGVAIILNPNPQKQQQRKQMHNERLSGVGATYSFAVINAASFR